ncbi:CgeB family protein [Halopenitus persicus]|uniref:CgeB family protein n=1 Tax=Halopenitus persicus TaxID=1048396 RepID=UPI0015A2B5F0|nr:glycosyltransferase [Halopenitus persicus]
MKDLEQAVRRNSPDLVFVVKGSDFSRGNIEQIRVDSDATIINWNPDNPFKVRSKERRMQEYLDALPEYDAVFIWSEELFAPLRENGARNVELLPFGYTPELHYPARSKPKYECATVFLGHWSKKRQRYLTPLAESDIDLSIYGGGWKRHCFDRTVRRHVQGGPVTGEEYSVAMCSADVVLNIVADHNLNAYNFRSFEIPATGSAMLTTHTERQEEIFGDGAAYANDPEELLSETRRLLSNPDERQRMAERGADRVQPHTIRTRMERVIETV